jgi:hypothetical protein
VNSDQQRHEAMARPLSSVFDDDRSQADEGRPHVVNRKEGKRSWTGFKVQDQPASLWYWTGRFDRPKVQNPPIMVGIYMDTSECGRGEFRVLRCLPHLELLHELSLSALSQQLELVNHILLRCWRALRWSCLSRVSDTVCYRCSSGC